MTDLLVLPDELLEPLDRIAVCITEKRVVVNDSGKITGEEFCRKKFSEAHALFQCVDNRLQAWSHDTGHSIPVSVLTKMGEKLIGLKKDIDDLPDDRDKNQFREEWNQLNKAVDSFMPTKDVS